ncbi:MAG: hypothetical protein JXB88_20330, partial [Spirochaetales bacterium]|nr:hypothetical protein [Spirochaetales bacterium]
MKKIIIPIMLLYMNVPLIIVMEKKLLIKNFSPCPPVYIQFSEIDWLDGATNKGMEVPIRGRRYQPGGTELPARGELLARGGWICQAGGS